MGTLVLIRHGQSLWNLENRFSGWSDVDLTDQGRSDAKKTAEVLRQFPFDRAFTSRLMRAKHTLDTIVDTLTLDLPIIEDSALNERHYGDLQGLNKAETADKLGKEQVQLWRRSFETRPPNGESIEDCVHRVWPFVRQYVLPHVHSGETVLVVSHGNSIRPIVKNLEDLDGDTTATLEIGLCTPYVYRFDGESVVDHEVLDVPGIVTKGASITEKKVEEGRV